MRTPRLMTPDLTILSFFVLFLIRFLWRRSGVFIVNFEHISHLVLVFLLLTLNM